MPWYANNFPSGHTTVGALLCLLLARVLTVLPWPVPGPVGRLRGLCFALAGLFGVLAVFPMGHVPSEMVGGFVLAGTAAQIAAGWIAAALPPPAPVPVGGAGRLLQTGGGRRPY
jgi:membrane-associated phospholipid phosphatase